MLGLYDGQTPHSFRVGCAVALSRSGIAGITEMKAYIGWQTDGMAEKYAKSREFLQNPVGEHLAQFVGRQSLVTPSEIQKGDTAYDTLPPFVLGKMGQVMAPK